MDQKFPFTTYDFWAYLSAGFLLAAALDQAAGTRLLHREQWTIVQGAITVCGAYVLGQLVASLSSWLFERMFVGKLLGYPRQVLFGQARAWKIVQRLLPSYFEQLPAATQLAVMEKGQKVGIGSAGEALFWAAYANARATPVVMNRLENFLNQYGFCRNTALVAFIDAAVLYWAYMQPSGDPAHLIWSRVALLIGIGLTLRYLKFLRHYSVEVFTSFAYAKEPEKKP